MLRPSLSCGMVFWRRGGYFRGAVNDKWNYGRTGDYESSVGLTSSMEQSLSWEDNRCLASQEIAIILRDPKINYSVHKFSQSSLFSARWIQPTPLHPPPLIKIYFNILLTSIHRTSKLYLSFRFFLLKFCTRLSYLQCLLYAPTNLAVLSLI